MTVAELFKIKAQKAVLEDVAKKYPGRTIENVIQNMDARISNFEKTTKRMSKDGKICSQHLSV